MPSIEQRAWIASGARQGTQMGQWESHPSAAGVLIVIDITNANAGLLNVIVEGRDPSTGSAYTVWQSANFSTNGQKRLVLFPSTLGGSGFDAHVQMTLPAEWRLKITDDAAVKTYSVSYEILSAA